MGTTEVERKSDSEYAKKILSIAREDLSCSYPFLAPAIYELKTVEDAEDAVRYGLSQNADAFLYSPKALVKDFVLGKDISTVFLHSVLHCVLLHPFFVPFYRDRNLWDLACDICIFDIMSSLNRNGEVTDTESKALSVLAGLKRKLPLLNARRVYSLLEKSDVSPEIFIVDDHHLWNAPGKTELKEASSPNGDPEIFRKWESIARKVELSLQRTLRSSDVRGNWLYNFMQGRHISHSTYYSVAMKPFFIFREYYGLQRYSLPNIQHFLAQLSREESDERARYAFDRDSERISRNEVILDMLGPNRSGR